MLAFFCGARRQHEAQGQSGRIREAKSRADLTALSIFGTLGWN